MNETARVESESRPRQGESVAQTLRRSLLQLDSRRGAAYGRLNQALRGATKPGAPPNHFQVVCANVTEELKLVSEGVMALRTSLVEQKLPHWQTGVKWIDMLQDLEEKKLVAFVSLHALHRSKDAGKLLARPDSTSSSETLQTKISRYAKELDEIDTEIRDLLQEVREFIEEQ